MIAHTIPVFATVAPVAELLDPITLSGRHVRLEPLSIEHVGGLVAASTVERDTYGYTDARNTQSRAAIERIGATFEGILRNHRLRYNTTPVEPRNTAVYSITDADWPAIKRGLEPRLDIAR